MVGDVFDFDNIAFSKPINQTTPSIRYLACADCDLAPIGFQSLLTQQAPIYVLSAALTATEAVTRVQTQHASQK
jgi:hypothetical protein